MNGYDDAKTWINNSTKTSLQSRSQGRCAETRNGKRVDHDRWLMVLDTTRRSRRSPLLSRRLVGSCKLAFGYKINSALFFESNNPMPSGCSSHSRVKM